MYNQTKRTVLWMLSALGLPLSHDALALDNPSASRQDAGLKKFPYEIVTVKGSKAFEEWTRLKTLNRGIPVVIGGDQDLERIIEYFDYMKDEAHSPSPAELLEASKAIRFPEDWNKLEDTPDDKVIGEMMGQWPTGALQDEPGLTVATDVLTGKFLTRVHILLIPAKASWEVPAYLYWGGWNACPPPEYHVAALRYLRERYGAELIGISGDVLNVRVQTLANSREEAIQLAIGLYRYCPDNVDQGVNEIAVLAALLTKLHWWYFWWD